MDLTTAGSIVQQAATQLGLAGAAYSDGTALADPYSSTDQNIIRLRALLTALGQELRGERQWSLFRQGYIFSTVLGNGLYPLPADYDRTIDQSGWNRTNRLPLGGPISAQDRAMLKALLVNVTFTVLFDIVDGQFSAYPDNAVLPGNFLLAYYYQSLWWVRQAYPNWSASVAYVAGNIVNSVLLPGAQYYCLVGGQAGGVDPGSNIAGFGAVPGIIGGGFGTPQWLYIPPWTANTQYTVTPVVNGTTFTVISANGSLYKCASAGKSIANGQGPSDRGIGIPDGVLAPSGVPASGQPTWTWVAALTLPNAGAPSASSDVVYYDQPFAVSALKRRWRVENGWPISQEMKDDFDRAFAKAKAADAVGKVLALDKRAGGVPLIGSANIPFTGFGL